MGRHNTGIDFVSRLRTSLNRQQSVALSAGQCYFLDGLVHRYRNQLTRLLPTDLQLSAPPQEADYMGPVQTVPDMFSGEESPPHETENHAKNSRRQRSLF